MYSRLIYYFLSVQFEFSIDDVDGDVLDIQVLDYDVGARSDTLGSLLLPLRRLASDV
jgi:hypothetical protein